MGKNAELQEVTKKFQDSEASHKSTIEDFKKLSNDVVPVRPLLGANPTLLQILVEVKQERDRQDAKWGVQHHPDGTGTPEFKAMADQAREMCNKAFKEGKGTWKHILTEEFMEAMAESDPEKLITELEQTMAVGAAWIEDIRGRTSQEAQGQDTKK